MSPPLAVSIALAKATSGGHTGPCAMLTPTQAATIRGPAIVVSNTFMSDPSSNDKILKLGGGPISKATHSNPCAAFHRLISDAMGCGAERGNDHSE
jgi:hypothetical protein